jgi:hypothetical protein
MALVPLMSVKICYYFPLNGLFLPLQPRPPAFPCLCTAVLLHNAALFQLLPDLCLQVLSHFIFQSLLLVAVQVLPGEVEREVHCAAIRQDSKERRQDVPVEELVSGRWPSRASMRWWSRCWCMCCYGCGCGRCSGRRNRALPSNTSLRLPPGQSR